MSPLPIRRYRAERLLQTQFEAMKGRVLATVRGRLRAAGVRLDQGDLEACYAQAWHGLYTTMLEGKTEVANPEGWLALVTYRRALDEHRGHGSRVTPVGDPGEPGRSAGAGASAMTGSRGAGSARRVPRARATHARASTNFESACDRDLADDLDDRLKLRRVLEGLRSRLGPRERQAAALCYLQGLSRAQAAAQMGISEARMRKLMDGSRSGSPGVAGKVGELLDAIRAGSYCAEQASLMRGFAFGILDPAGERYVLALAHQRECPACRAHVLALRGLAAVLPPLPLPLVIGAVAAGGAGAGAGAGATAGAGGAGAGAAASAGGAGAAGTGAGAGGAGASGGTVGAGAGMGTGAGVGVSAGGVGASAGVSGVAGAGAGGGWLMAGGLGAKLAVGCLVAVGVGASCAALTIIPVVSHRGSGHHSQHARAQDARAGIVDRSLTSAQVGAPLGAEAAPAARAAAPAGNGLGRTTDVTPAAKASQEFGLEQPARQTASSKLASVSDTARTASAGGGSPGGAGSSGAGGSSAGAIESPGASESTAAKAGSQSQPHHESGGPSAAAREFGLG